MFAYCLNDPVNRTDANGNWSMPNRAKVAIGVGAIAIGVAATVISGGAAAPALAIGIKTAICAGVVSAGSCATIETVKSVNQGRSIADTLKNVGKAAIDGFCDGFMWGGVGFGAARSLGMITKKTHIFKRDVTYRDNNFMFGDSELTVWRHGKKFRIDISAEKGVHYHMKTSLHGLSYHRTKYIREIYGTIVGIGNGIHQILER